MRRSAKNQLLDRLHRGFVVTCIGVTLYGTYLLGARVHRYVTVIRPARQEAELRKIEEGTYDKAPELKA